jgi:hypothetical protein
MPQPPLPQPPAGSVTVTLTPDQWKLLQQLLHLGPPHLNLPLSTGTIGFDIFPNTITALPSGTDLTQHQLYQLIDGVTFSADPGPGGVYAVTDPSGRSRNVLSLAAPPTIPWFSGRHRRRRVLSAADARRLGRARHLRQPALRALTVQQVVDGVVNRLRAHRERGATAG